MLCARESKTTREEAWAAAKQALQRFPDLPVGLVITGSSGPGRGDYELYAYSYSYS